MIKFIIVLFIITNPNFTVLGDKGYELPNTSTNLSSPPESLPVILWHGMGDSCCNPFSMGYIKKLIESHLKNYVVSLEIGNSVVQDTENGFFMDVNQQIDMVCRQIKLDPKLKNGYNAIGFSQGSQFLRGIAQRCPQGMKNLISIGGQHQGVYGIPSCIGEDHTLCDYVRRLLNYGAYKSWIQNMLVQAQYWHDPLDEETYRSKSKFIADINNERIINKTYVENLNKLNKFIMVKFNQDTVVDPKETEWFQFFTPGQAKVIEPLNKSRVYTRLSLDLMEADGKLVFLATDGNHLQMSETFFVEEIIKKYLN